MIAGQLFKKQDAAAYLAFFMISNNIQQQK